MYTVSKTHQPEEAAMAQTYYSVMMRLMAENPDVMELEADLAVCILGGGYRDMMTAFPGRLVNCGIQEANMVGVACGLSAVNKIPFLHTFAPFISRRANDQVFISGCYAGSNIRLVGSDPGVMAAFNGGTHMPFEDIAALRAFPEMTIIEPSDSAMLTDLMEQLINLKGVFYIRTARKTMNKIYETGSHFDVGRGNILRDGNDVTLVASGLMVADALEAAEKLAQDGVSARVVDMFTIKPIDSALLERCARETGAIVTAENHNIIGGLGSAVCEAVASLCPVPVERVGVRDQFGEVGPIEFLKEKFGLTPDEIVKKARTAIQGKK